MANERHSSDSLIWQAHTKALTCMLEDAGFLGAGNSVELLSGISREPLALCSLSFCEACNTMAATSDVVHENECIIAHLEGTHEETRFRSGNVSLRSRADLKNEDHERTEIELCCG